jgi:hypothetical protein
MPQADTIGKASQLKVCRQDLVPAHFGPVKAGPSLARSLTNVVDRPAPSKALRQLACVLPQTGADVRTGSVAATGSVR